MNAKERNRRRFLKEGAALAGLAVGATRFAGGQQLTPVETFENTKREIPARFQPTARRLYGTPSPFETAKRQPKTPATIGWMTPLQDLTGVITPSGLHFEIGMPAVDIDPRQHRLLIHGLVDRPLVLTPDDLKHLPSVTRVYFIECAGNGSPTGQAYMRNGGFMKNEGLTLIHTHGSTSCAEWTGVPLSVLLREVGVQKGASWVIAESVDAGKLTRSIPLEKALDDVMVAYGQNGEAIRPEQGYPMRLLVPGWEGNVSVKWLRQIRVADRPYESNIVRAETPGLKPDAKGRWWQYQVGPKSVITFPSIGQHLPSPGFYEIIGLAWSGGGAIRKVEVSIDGRRTWKDARLDEPVHRMAHTRFRFPWTWDGKETVIASRCTDERGDVQPTLEELTKLWGVSLEYWLTASGRVEFFNPINPWRITPEGSVRNALYPLPL